MITLALVVLFFMWLRGFSDYITQADSWGWRLPSWYDKTRNKIMFKWMIGKDGKPNQLAQIIPFRAHWHMWQFVKNRSVNVASVLMFYLFYKFIVLHDVSFLYIYVLLETFWVIGHGFSFSIMKNVYNERITLIQYIKAKIKRK